MASTSLRGPLTEEREYSDEEVISAWKENADPWSRAVRERRIESRNLVTDKAIVDAVMSCDPRTVLDLGCGEGWLTRELSGRGVACIGVDAIPSLIERARSLGGGDFRVASYEEIASDGLDVMVDLVVANFSLIGGDAVDGAIRRVRGMLRPDGHLVIQTPHPVVATEPQAYVDGWREGSWAGCGGDFSSPAPWYFRTIGTWVGLLRAAGLGIVDLREPLHPATGKPASLILIGRMG